MTDVTVLLDARSGGARRQLHAPRLLIILPACLCMLALTASCQRSDGSRLRKRLPQLDVILVTIDTLRADHVGSSGGRAATPNLDRLASRGVLFSRCIAQVPLTLPSHTTILSGTYPLYHGVRGNGDAIVPDSLELVSEVLKAHGFATSAFVGAYVLHSKWGLGQGFDHYDDAFDRTRYRQLELQNSKRAEEVIASAEEWLRSHRDSHFFCWIHLFDPHAPYDPPAPFDRYRDEPYRGEVEYTDHAVGRLLDFLQAEGLDDSCLVIVTSDHGEGLGEHGEQEHGFFVYEPAVRVPLIVRAPFALPSQRWDGLVELVDVAPTILDAMAVPVPSSYQGESLWNVMLGDGDPESSVAYSETYYPRLHYGWSELKALYRGDLKLISAPRPELYDLRADELEQANLAADPFRASERESLEGSLREFVGRHSAGALPASAATLSRRDAAALRALGYVTTTVDTSGPVALPDPKDRISTFNRLADAAGFLEAGHPEQAIAAADEALRSEPRLVEALVLLGNAYERAGRLQEAAAMYRRVLELKPDANFTMIDLLGVLLNLGAFDDAVRAGEAFVVAFPDDAVLHEQLGYAYRYRGEVDRALEHLLRSVEIEPDAFTLGKVGEVYVVKGDDEAAESYLHRALELNPGNPGSCFLLGLIEESRGNKDRAIELYDRELESNPGEYRAAFNIAVILRDRGRADLAVPYCRRAIAANPRFNIPYFMIARYSLDSGTNLDEAIELCEKGIEVAPEEESALIGYQTLLLLYGKTGDRAGYELYAGRAKALLRKLGRASQPSP